MAGRFEGVSDGEGRLCEAGFPPVLPKRGRGMPHAPFRKRSSWIPGSWHVRMGYTDAIPFHDPSQESNRAGQHHESHR